MIGLLGAGASPAAMRALVSVPATEKFIVLRTQLLNFHSGLRIVKTVSVTKGSLSLWV